MDCSVIIPVYNAEKTLEACVASVLMQDNIDFELILVDDGSNDECSVLCDKLKETDSRISVIHKSNDGVSSARNAGLEVAKGNFIFFADSDDLLKPNALQILLEAQNMSKSDLIVADYETIEIKTGIVQKQMCGIPYEVIMDINYIRNEVYSRIYLRNSIGIATLCNKLFSNEMIKKNKLRFDEKRTHGEDWAFVIDYIKCIKSLYAIPDIVYSYNLDGSQQYMKYRKGLMYSFIDGYRRTNRLLEEGLFQPTEREMLIHELNFFQNVMFLLETYANGREIKSLMQSDEVERTIHNIEAAKFSELFSIGYTKRIRLVTFFLKMKLYKQAISQYKKCI